MAITLALVKSTPYSMALQVHADTNATAQFVRSGVVAADTVPLSTLKVGPLRSYLTRLPNWSGLATDPRIKVRLVQPAGVGAPAVPVNTAVARGVAVAHGADAIGFQAAISASESLVEYEISFIHSMNR